MNFAERPQHIGVSPEQRTFLRDNLHTLEQRLRASDRELALVECIRYIENPLSSWTTRLHINHVRQGKPVEIFGELYFQQLDTAGQESAGILRITHVLGRNEVLQDLVEFMAQPRESEVAA